MQNREMEIFATSPFEVTKLQLVFEVYIANVIDEYYKRRPEEHV